MNKPFFRILLSSVLLTQLPACGFHLRGYDAPMSQNIPTTELIFNNSPEAYACLLYQSELPTNLRV